LLPARANICKYYGWLTCLLLFFLPSTRRLLRCVVVEFGSSRSRSCPHNGNARFRRGLHHVGFHDRLNIAFLILAPCAGLAVPENRRPAMLRMINMPAAMGAGQ